MRILSITLLILVIALEAPAGDLGNRASQKPTAAPTPLPTPLLEILRQGGDTIADATPIVVNTLDLAGSTTGYTDDYDVACPYWEGPPAPDVVYSLLSESDQLVDVVPSDNCNIDCPAGAAIEGEPSLQADYVDLHNGGCNTDGVDPPLQEINSTTFCGVSGWYLNGGDLYRDTDWLTIPIPSGGILEVTLEAKADTRLLEIGPQECGAVDILQEVTSVDCETPTLTVAGEAGTTVWLWVGPAGYYPSNMPFDAFEYDYVLTTNLGTVATDEQTWSGVKAMYR